MPRESDLERNRGAASVSDAQRDGASCSLARSDERANSYNIGS
jgi:hypothetical protein